MVKNVVSQRQPRHRKKHKQSQPLTDTKDNTSDYNLRPRPPPTNPTTSRTMQRQSTHTFTSGKTTRPTRPTAKCMEKAHLPQPPAQHRPKPGYTQHNLPTCNSINPIGRRMQKNVQPPQQARATAECRTPCTTQARTRPCAEGRENRHIPQPQERHRHTSTRPTDRPTDRPQNEWQTSTYRKLRPRDRR